MWKILARILEEHLAFHLAIPLIVGLLFNATVGHFLKGRSWSSFRSDLVSIDNLLFAAGAILTYLVIIYFQTWRETSAPMRDSDLALLSAELESATDYFATSAITLKEWFDPVSQVFLSSIIKKKISASTFHDERVLLFERRRDFEGATLPYLDGYYGRRLAYIHKNLGTPLGYLQPNEVRGLLFGLPRKTRDTLRIHPWWCSWLPDRILKWRILHWPVLIKRTDFAFITHQDTSGSKWNTVLVVNKKNETLRVVRIGEKGKLEAYEELVDAISHQIRMGQSPVQGIDAEHDFIKLYFPT